MVTAARASDPGDFEAASTGWLAELPALFDFVWEAAYDLAQVWVVVIAVFALVRRRWGLLRDWAASMVITGLGVALAGWIIEELREIFPLYCLRHWQITKFRHRWVEVDEFHQ